MSRPNYIQIRLHDAELDSYNRQAGRNGVSLAEWIRNTCNWEVKLQKETNSKPKQIRKAK